MTREEAKKKTTEGLWQCIDAYIKNCIEGSCSIGETSTTVNKCRLNDADKDRLIKLGYTVKLHDDDPFFPEYTISWN